ncbi:hypothetical protein ACFX14_009032 [Malus domestica]
MDVACSLMLDKCVSNHLWGHAVLVDVYLINRVPSRVLDFQTPFDVLQKHISLVSVSKLHLKVFGCIVYVHVYSHQRSKLDAYALRCVFVGYANNKKGYKCYHPPTQKTYITMDVTFHEEVSYFVKPSSDFPLQGEMGSEVQIRRDDSDRSPVIPGTISTDDRSDVPSELPVSMSDELPSDDQLPAADMSNELPDDGLSNDDFSNSLVQDGGIHELSRVSIPTKLKDALSDPKWVNAMKVEMEALEKNSTLDLVPLPNGKKVVRCRWVFTIKHKVDGSIDRYKARLVAKGYTQPYGVDY